MKKQHISNTAIVTFLKLNINNTIFICKDTRQNRMNMPQSLRTDLLLTQRQCMVVKS